MAKYHEDTVPKHKLTEEERGFLLALQKELNTQDTLCQADPRFWVIMDYERSYGAITNGDPVICYYGEDYNSYEDLRPLMEEVIKEELLYDYVSRQHGEDISYRVSGDGFSGFAQIVGDDGDTIESFMSVEDAAEFLRNYDYAVEVWGCEERRHICPSTFFMTYKEAVEHLKANAHHYSDQAHPYAMTAWRSPEVERLWKILQQVEW